MTDDEKFKFLAWIGGGVISIIGIAVTYFSYRFTVAKKIRKIEEEYHNLHREVEKLKGERGYDRDSIDKLQAMYEKMIDYVLQLFGAKPKP